MKKILTIIGSFQKEGAGMEAVQLFQKNFDEQEYEFEMIRLSECNIQYCRGCTACFKHQSGCPIQDDVPNIIEKMVGADGIIWSTPVYGMNVSGVLKTLIDRTSMMLHRPVLYGKQAFVIATADVGGTGLAVKYLKYMNNAYGMVSSGGVGIYSHRIKTDREYQNRLTVQLKKEATKFKRALAIDGRARPSLMQILRFTGWKTKNRLSKDAYPGDYDYWQRMGWFEMPYYTPIKLNVFQKIVVRFVTRRTEKIVSKGMGLDQGKG